MQQKQHAYLIIAHTELDILTKTLNILDDKAADMYIHIDKKTKNFNEGDIKNGIRFSNVYFIKRRNVQWGSDSQIKCELDLLEAAAKRNYAYYHLISGSDVSIKTPVEINRYFSDVPDRIYLHFTENDDNIQGTIQNRIRYYNLFQQKIGRGAGFRVALYEQLNNYVFKVQKHLKIDRMKSYNGVFYKGSSWFSIPHDFALYVVSQRKTIKKYFYHSACADEIFVQTIAMNCIPTVLYLPKGSSEFKFRDYYYSTGRYKFPIARSVEEALETKPCPLPDLTGLRDNLLRTFPYDLWEG